MRCMLLGCSVLALLSLSVSAENFLVQQKPRFYGVKVGKQVGFTCSASDCTLDSLVVEWYKIEVYEERAKVYNDHMPPFTSSRAFKHSGNTKGQLFIKKVEFEDSGIYYCRINQTWGPGTELQVFRQSNPKVAEWRSNMKDMIIFLQAFLLVLCIVLPLVRYYKLEKKEEAIYEEPENDHTYEGLEIEHCGDLYEDLTAFSQSQEGEASWEVELPEKE